MFAVNEAKVLSKLGDVDKFLQEFDDRTQFQTSRGAKGFGRTHDIGIGDWGRNGQGCHDMERQGGIQKDLSVTARIINEVMDSAALYSLSALVRCAPGPALL